MRKPILGIAVMFLLVTSASAQSGQEQREISTRFGVLSVNDEKRLLFKGQSLRPPIDGNNSFDLGEVVSIDATDVVLVTDNGGTACPYMYYFVSVSQSEVKASPPFGSCGQLASMKRSGTSISVIMPGYRGPHEAEAAQRRAARQRHVFIFRAGVVSQNGKPVK
ncbi:hypothetical protein BH18ACI4_BH18ACI4_17440 [soil metagenome]